MFREKSCEPAREGGSRIPEREGDGNGTTAFTASACVRRASVHESRCCLTLMTQTSRMHVGQSVAGVVQPRRPTLDARCFHDEFFVVGRASMGPYIAAQCLWQLH